ncbi:MAG: hypothetical protein ACYC0J_06305 [Gammaproteobacteria bacterium]
MSKTRNELNTYVEQVFTAQYDKIEKVNERIKTVMENITLLRSSADKLQLDVKFCERTMTTMPLDLMQIQRDTVLQMLGMVQGCYQQLQVDEVFIQAYHQRKKGLLANLKTTVDTIAAMTCNAADKPHFDTIKHASLENYNLVVTAFNAFDQICNNLSAYEESVTKSIEATGVITKAYDSRVPAAASSAAAPSVATNKHAQFANNAPADDQALDQQQTANKKPKKRSGGCNIM